MASDTQLSGEQIWRASLPLLAEKVSPATYDGFLTNATALEFTGEDLRLGVVNEFARDWLERHQHRLSPKAYLARKATIAPRLRDQAPWRALGWILRARLQGASSTASCVGQLCRLIHPPAYLWLQRLSGKGSAS